VLHNVHIIPIVAGNKESNTAQLPKSKDLVYSFAKEEQFLKFKCDVHPWMYSYVTVMSHPFYSVSGEDGTFKIENVPPWQGYPSAARSSSPQAPHCITSRGGGASLPRIASS
jgi:hypothetical protein